MLSHSNNNKADTNSKSVDMYERIHQGKFNMLLADLQIAHKLISHPVTLITCHAMANTRNQLPSSRIARIQ